MNQFSVNEAKNSIVLETIALGETINELPLASGVTQSFVQGHCEGDTLGTWPTRDQD